MSADDEVRREFEAWFRTTGSRELEGTVPRIDESFEFTRGHFRWDIPDLKILVRGDLAVTWGMNHLPSRARGEQWSRGTRVFQKIAGQWRLIHQHVSFPYDPEPESARAQL